MTGPATQGLREAQVCWDILPRHDEKPGNPENPENPEKPHPATSFLRLMEENAKLEAARAKYDHASTWLELAHIRQRLAHLGSQWNPANAILEDKEIDMRTKLLHAAEWVVIGRAVTDG